MFSFLSFFLIIIIVILNTILYNLSFTFLSWLLFFILLWFFLRSSSSNHLLLWRLMLLVRLWRVLFLFLLLFSLFSFLFSSSSLFLLLLLFSGFLCSSRFSFFFFFFSFSFSFLFLSSCSSSLIIFFWFFLLFLWLFFFLRRLLLCGSTLSLSVSNKNLLHSISCINSHCCCLINFLQENVCIFTFLTSDYFYRSNIDFLLKTHLCEIKNFLKNEDFLILVLNSFWISFLSHKQSSSPACLFHCSVDNIMNIPERRSWKQFLSHFRFIKQLLKTLCLKV